MTHPVRDDDIHQNSNERGGFRVLDELTRAFVIDFSLEMDVRGSGARGDHRRGRGVAKIIHDFG